jgi:hypothetical protein
MSRNNTLREYFDRARFDADFRARSIANTKHSKTLFGWLVLLQAFVAVGEVYSGGLHDGERLWRTIAVCSVSCIVMLSIYDKMSDRLIMLLSLDGAPNQSTDPILVSGTPAGAPSLAADQFNVRLP